MRLWFHCWLEECTMEIFVVFSDHFDRTYYSNKFGGLNNTLSSFSNAVGVLRQLELDTPNCPDLLVIQPFRLNTSSPSDFVDLSSENNWKDILKKTNINWSDDGYQKVGFKLIVYLMTRYPDIQIRIICYLDDKEGYESDLKSVGVTDDQLHRIVWEEHSLDPKYV